MDCNEYGATHSTLRRRELGSMKSEYMYEIGLNMHKHQGYGEDASNQHDENSETLLTAPRDIQRHMTGKETRKKKKKKEKK